jgi:D-amino peptidase
MLTTTHEGETMRIWISCDMEGVAGVVDWDQCRPGGDGYALGCALMQDEVNAAIEGALAGGATEFVVNDSHGRMANLDPRKIAGRASYLSGRHKPLYMVEGLDDSFDAVFLVGYHGSISGRPSTLSHTYNPEVFAGVRVNGQYVGESGINALVMAHYGVPIALVSGDRVTAEEAAPFAPDAVSVLTKESITRAAALNLHPDESGRLIREGAEEAVRRIVAGRLHAPAVERPAVLDLEFATGDMADIASWARNTERTGERTARIADDDLLSAYRSFVAVSYLTRQVGGR